MSDADWQFMSVASNDLTTLPTDTATTFTNTFPVPMMFQSNNVQVALFSLSYFLATGGKNTFFLNTSLVAGLQIIGSDVTNSVRLFTLTDGSGTWEPQRLQWLDAVTSGGAISLVQVTITDIAGADAVDLTGPNLATFVFRELE